MAKSRKKFGSPRLEVAITPENWKRAVESASGGCLIADAIKSQYPHLSKPTVDMATVRISDRLAGVRYTYLTPPQAQHLLLGFDQGWPQPAETVVLKRAVVITPITRSKGSKKTSPEAIRARREARIAELEAKLTRGEQLTRGERAALTRMYNSTSSPDRPRSKGPADVKVAANGQTTVEGGPPPVQGKAHPNLLRGRDRHYGAKLADPGRAFTEAVEAAVAEKLATKSSG